MITSSGNKGITTKDFAPLTQKVFFKKKKKRKEANASRKRNRR